MLAPVLALHLSALMLGAPGHSGRGRHAHTGAPPVRLVAMIAPSPTNASAIPALPEAGERSAHAHAAVVPRPGAAAAQESAQRVAQNMSKPEPSPALPIAAPLPSASALDSAAADKAGLAPDYLPRALLSVAPRPLASIDIAFPPEVPGEVNLATELSLFIDEMGVVRRVRVDGAALPPALEEAARTAFMNAHFTPGELDGAPVRALIRVAVSFNTDAMPQAALTR